MSGILYGVGVGPGDPELLTLKAKKVLEKVDYICTPQVSKEKKSIALTIIDDVVDYQGKIKKMHFPMTGDQKRLNNAWDKVTEEIVDLLRDNYNVAFITLGDPLLYSTYNYILKNLRDYEDFAIETVPGINSINASAARLNLPLTEGDENLAFLPLPSKPQELEKILTTHKNIVFMKVSRNYDLLLDKLKKHGLEKSSYLVSRCGQKQEFITEELNSYTEDEIPYLSLVITKNNCYRS